MLDDYLNVTCGVTVLSRYEPDESQLVWLMVKGVLSQQLVSTYLDPIDARRIGEFLISAANIAEANNRLQEEGF